MGDPFVDVTRHSIGRAEEGIELLKWHLTDTKRRLDEVTAELVAERRNRERAEAIAAGLDMAISDMADNGCTWFRITAQHDEDDGWDIYWCRQSIIDGELYAQTGQTHSLDATVSDLLNGTYCALDEAGVEEG